MLTKVKENKNIRLKLFNYMKVIPKQEPVVTSINRLSCYLHSKLCHFFWSESKCFVLFLVVKKHSIGVSKRVFYNDDHKS